MEVEEVKKCYIMLYEHTYDYLLFPENYLKGVKIVHDMTGKRLGFTKQVEKTSNDLLILLAIIVCFVVVAIVIYLVARFIKQRDYQESKFNYDDEPLKENYINVSESLEEEEKQQ